MTEFQNKYNRILLDLENQLLSHFFQFQTQIKSFPFFFPIPNIVKKIFFFKRYNGEEGDNDPLSRGAN